MSKPYMQSPLHHFDLQAKVKPQDSTCGVWANEVLGLGFIILRGDVTDPSFVKGVGSVLEVALPTQPCTFSRSNIGTLLWLSPDEWLLICSRTDVKDLTDALESILSGLHVQIIDNSGGLTQMYLTGQEHVTLLRHIGVYDFESIEPGKVIGTVCGKASIVAYRLDEHGLFVVFRRSFADYFWRLLERAARPYGFGVCALPTGKGHHAAVKSTAKAELLSA